MDRKKIRQRGPDGRYISVKLTEKERRFADRRIDYPKESATESANQVYNVANRPTAATIASENLRKPHILKYLEKHKEHAQENIIQLADNAKNEAVRLRANESILDRTYGKPIHRQVSIRGTIEDLIVESEAESNPAQ